MLPGAGIIGICIGIGMSPNSSGGTGGISMCGGSKAAFECGKPVGM